jgi:hypothetical protein
MATPFRALLAPTGSTCCVLTSFSHRTRPILFLAPLQVSVERNRSVQAKAPTQTHKVVKAPAKIGSNGNRLPRYGRSPSANAGKPTLKSMF